jgi:hypothetical protein
MTAHVYRLFAEDGTLLYIGRTEDFETRLRMHLCTTSRLDSRVTGWETIHERYHHHTLEAHPDLAAAKVAEVAAIRTERPLLNVHFNTGKVWRSRPTRVRTVVLDEPGDTPSTALGYHLGRAMLAAGHSTQSLADAADVAPTKLARALAGRGVRIGDLLKVADVLGVRVSDMLRTAEECAA